MWRHLQFCTLLALLLWLQLSVALKCRSEDGPSDGELKRVTRRCMRKITENSHDNGAYNTGSNSNFHYGSNGRHYNGNNNYGQQQSNYRTDYDSDEDADVSDGNNYGNYERNGGNSGNSGNSGNGVGGNHQRGGGILGNRSGGNGNAGGTGSGRSSNNGANNNNNADNTRNTNSRAYNNYNNNNNNNNNNKQHNNNGGYSGSSAGNGRQNGDNNRNNGTTYDSGCVVHCFFDDMNMLNRDGYPDRHKVNYMLTKDIRDRELRNFYADTIQSCFRYLESQRRHDKCHFSRELIQCMAEYAKANCDDWEEFNVIFN